MYQQQQKQPVVFVHIYHARSLAQTSHYKVLNELQIIHTYTYRSKYIYLYILKQKQDASHRR